MTKLLKYWNGLNMLDKIFPYYTMCGESVSFCYRKHIISVFLIAAYKPQTSNVIRNEWYTKMNQSSTYVWNYSDWKLLWRYGLDFFKLFLELCYYQHNQTVFLPLLLFICSPLKLGRKIPYALTIQPSSKSV